MEAGNLTPRSPDLNALLDEFDYGSWIFQKNWNWFFARNFNPSHKVDFISGMVVK